MSKTRDQTVAERSVPPHVAVEAEDALVGGHRIETPFVPPATPGSEYEATELATGSRVVLKVLPEHLSGDPAFRVRFRRDAKTLAAIDHDHLLTIDGGEWGPDLFVVVRPMHGRPLKELIDSGGLDESRTIRALEPVADALDVAHSEGLLHRAVTPESIIVDSHGDGFLADFGLTPVDLPELLDAGEFTGTLNYAAPERIGGEPESRKSDIYSLAAVLHECLMGEAPEHAGERAEPWDAAVDLPSDARSATIEDVLRHALARDPVSRPRTAGELIREAERAIERAPAKARRRALRRPTGASSPRRARARASERKAQRQATSVPSPRRALAALVGPVRGAAKAWQPRRTIARAAAARAERPAAQRAERVSWRARAALRLAEWRADRAARVLWRRRLGARVSSWRAERASRIPLPRRASTGVAAWRAERAASAARVSRALTTASVDRAERRAVRAARRKRARLRASARRAEQREMWAERRHRLAVRASFWRSERLATGAARGGHTILAAVALPVRLGAGAARAPRAIARGVRRRGEHRATGSPRPRPQLARAAIAAALVAPAAIAGIVVGGGGSSADRSPARANTAQAKAVTTAIGDLNAARSSGRRRLLESRTPDEQAARAVDLARAYDNEVGAVGAFAAGGGGQRAATRSVSAALIRARGAYLQLAATAQRRDRAGYDRGRRDVAQSEAALGSALARMAG